MKMMRVMPLVPFSNLHVRPSSAPCAHAAKHQGSRESGRNVSPKRVNSPKSPVWAGPRPPLSWDERQRASLVHRLAAACDHELGVEIRYMRLYRVGRQAELQCDFLVGMAPRQQLQHLHLLPREPEGFASRLVAGERRLGRAGRKPPPDPDAAHRKSRSDEDDVDLRRKYPRHVLILQPLQHKGAGGQHQRPDEDDAQHRGIAEAARQTGNRGQQTCRPRGHMAWLSNSPQRKYNGEAAKTKPGTEGPGSFGPAPLLRHSAAVRMSAAIVGKAKA